jgi:hypothetical protein
MNQSFKLSTLLAIPVVECINAQEIINKKTIALIDKYHNDENYGITKFKTKHKNIDHEIAIPTISMINIPSLHFNKLNVSMNVRQLNQVKKEGKCSKKKKPKIMFALSDNNSKMNTYKIYMELGQNSHRQHGVNKLNSLLMENICSSDSIECPCQEQHSIEDSIEDSIEEGCGCYTDRKEK